MKSISVYSASEMKENFPDIYAGILKKWKSDCYGDIFWQEDIIESMKKV